MLVNAQADALSYAHDRSEGEDPAKPGISTGHQQPTHNPSIEAGFFTPAPMIIPFTKFAPDADPTTPGIITDATNLVPTVNGYAGGPSGADVGMDALAAAALSAAVMSKLDATNRLFAGTTTALYEKSSMTWTDVSRASPAYNASTTYPWRFAQYGDTSLAINKGDVLQYTNSGDFADVADAPKAASICVASDFVMLFNTNETTYGDSLDRWWCSAYLDFTDWVPDVATQCTTGRLVKTPGALIGGKPLGDNVVAYKANSMYFGVYAGPPVVWDFTPVPGEIGCASIDAVANIGTAHIFVGPQDIYLFDGTLPVGIGGPIREWFYADLDPAYTYRIRSAHDMTNALVYFYYPRLGSSGSLTGCIVYHYKTDKWGVAHRSIECPVDYVSGGYTYDTIPMTTWDDWPAVPYDSPFWTSSYKYIGYFGTDHKIKSLTGGCESASLTTSSYGIENEYSLLRRVTMRYKTRPTTCTLTNYYADVHGDTWTTDATTTESNGRCDVLRSAVWHRGKFDLTGDFEVVGITADLKPNGVL